MRNDKDRTSLADLRHIPLDHRFGFIVQCAQDGSASNPPSPPHIFSSSINEFQPFLWKSSHQLLSRLGLCWAKLSSNCQVMTRFVHILRSCRDGLTRRVPSL
jgi:hypothetical protein